MKSLKLKMIFSAAAICATLGTVGCSNKNNAISVDIQTGKDSYKVGILQPIEHDALTAAREGFVEALKENGFDGKVTINYQNANGVEADITTLAKSLTTSCDLTLGIGTGASVALQSAQVNSGSTKPIFFTAVTDPVDAGLVNKASAPEGYITGTSDANPVEAQIDLIKECVPSADKIGILYTQSETNSEVQANQAEAEAKKQGLSVVRSTCTDSSDLQAVAANLAATSGIDAIYIPTDNLIAANMGTVKSVVEAESAKSNGNKVLLVCGEDNMMAQGGHVTLSVSYKELGRRTGKMAAQLLKGEKKVSQLPVTTMSKEECTYMMCQTNLEAAQIILPDSVTSKCTNVAAK